MTSLASKTALVTGAAGGIGSATAARLAREGADLVLVDLEEDTLAETAAKVRAEGRTAFTFGADCTNADAVEALFHAVFEQTARVDILVNNIGQSARERASTFDVSEPGTWRFVLDVSLMTTMLCSRQVIPGMKARGSGKVINLSSDAALVGQAGAVDYAAAKSGVIGFTRALAMELATFGVNVNAICPGPTLTPAMARNGEAFLRSAEQIPMRRVGKPEEIAGVIAFLAGPDSDFITGQTLAVNGGRWML